MELVDSQKKQTLYFKRIGANHVYILLPFVEFNLQVSGL